MQSIDTVKPYLEYLDKEMTIMGILSTFCVAAAALVIERVGTAEPATFFGGLFRDHAVAVFGGAASLFLAGLFFYLQRSLLAHYYGGICMSFTGVFHDKEETTEAWLIEVYTAQTWRRYRTGFGFLAVTALLFAYCIYRLLDPQGPGLHLALIALLVLIAAAMSTDVYTLSDRIKARRLSINRRERHQHAK